MKAEAEAEKAERLKTEILKGGVFLMRSAEGGIRNF
jgi:hypothetical protein